MPSFPEPKVGLVISYAYLWSEEQERGQVEGRKDRPCAIVLAIEQPVLRRSKQKQIQVAVAPITHSSPRDPNAAVEIPQRVKHHLGLDSERSWAIVDEVNVFAWPGFDLRPIENRDGRVDYGFLPPKLFDLIIRRFSELAEQGAVQVASRD